MLHITLIIYPLGTTINSQKFFAVIAMAQDLDSDSEEAAPIESVEYQPRENQNLKSPEIYRTQVPSEQCEKSDGDIYIEE